jgi:hypothetical protein
LDWLATRPECDPSRLAVVSIGQAAVVALCAAALDTRIASVGLLDPLTTLITEEAYAAGTHMGLLAPGLLTAGDVPHLAAMVAPRPLLVLGGRTPQGKSQSVDELKKAFSFTRKVYGLENADKHLAVEGTASPADVARRLVSAG